jgi:hypothetical protein
VATGAVLASAGVNTTPTWAVSPSLTDLKLGGGAVGTSGVGVLACGPSTAPTTSPVDTVQLYTIDLAAEAGSRALEIRDERGGRYSFGTAATISAAMLHVLPPGGGTDLYLYSDATGGGIGTKTGPLWLWAGDKTSLTMTPAGNIECFGGVTGTSGVGVLALGLSTAPTTSPVDTVQLWSEDFAGAAGSHGLEVRDERGGRYSLASYSDGTAYIRAAHPAGPVADVQAGSSFVSYGTYTNYPVRLVQNNTVRLTLDTSGNTAITGNLTVSGTGTIASTLTVNGGSLGMPGGVSFQSSSSTAVIYAGAGYVQFNGNVVNLVNNSGQTDVRYRAAASPIGGHVWDFISAGSGSGVLGGPTSCAIYNASNGIYGLAFVPGPHTYLSCAGVGARLLGQHAPDSAGAGWRYLLIAN